MNLTVLVVTLLAASAGTASAQQDRATVYGVLDAGMVSEGGCPGNCALRVDSGMASESRFGVRGGETLSGAVALIYGVEAGVQIDSGRTDQGGRLFGRQAWVGVKGEAGAVTVGRQQNLEYSALTEVGDPFQGGTAGSATNLIGSGGRREDNGIAYRSNAVHGVSAAASYSRDDAAAQGALAMSGNRAWGMSLGFESGPWVLRAAHQNRAVAGAAPLTAMGNTLEAKNSIVAANFRLGFGTAYAAYSVSRGHASSPLWNPDNPYSVALASTPSNKSRDLLVGLAVPVGGATVLASFIRKNDRDLANRDANQLALGATYAIARHTDFYAAYSRINNRNGAAYTVGNASSQGSGSSAVNIGMRHGF